MAGMMIAVGMPKPRKGAKMKEEMDELDMMFDEEDDLDGEDEEEMEMDEEDDLDMDMEPEVNPLVDEMMIAAKDEDKVAFESALRSFVEMIIDEKKG